jgi:hypothetical protein
MNKNLLALSVAAASALAFSASAAVSSNIVGYVKLNLARGYNLVANPLNNTNPNGNTVGSLFGSVDCAILRWNGNGFNTTDIIGGVGVVNGENFTLAPGESVFVFVEAASSVTTVGEALVGTQTVTGPSGNSFVASKIPLSGKLGADLGLTVDGVSASIWNGSGYTTYDYLEGVGYIPEDPTIAVGQGLLVNTANAGGYTWTKTFTPAP